MKDKLYKALDILSILLFAYFLILSPIYGGGYKLQDVDKYIKLFTFFNVLWLIKYILKPYIIDKKMLYYLLFIISYFFPLMLFNEIIFLEEHKKLLLLMFLIFGTSIEAYKIFKERKDLFNNIIIVSSLITSLISIIYVFFPDIFNSFNIYGSYGDYYITSVYRLYGTFRYPNILGLFSLMGIILSLKYNKKNLIYKIIIYINTLCLILTMSKTILLFTIISLIIIFILDKDIKKIIISLIAPITLNVKLYGNMVLNNEFVLFILFSFILLIIYLLTCRFYKKYITIIAVVLFLGLGLIFNEKPLTIKSNNKNLFITEFMNLEKKEHELNINISGNDLDGYIYLNKHFIQNESMAYKIIEKISFSDNINIKFTPEDNAEFYSIMVENNGDKISIDKMVIKNNNEEKEVALNYYLWPYNYIKQFEQMNYDIGSVSSRFEIYKLSVEIIKDNPIFGHGYNHFKKVSINSKNLKKVLVEHSQIMSVGVENGVFGIILWCLLLIMILINCIRAFSKENVYNILVVFLLIYSSLYDFTMSFNFFLLLLFIFSMLLLNEKSKNILCICSEGGHLSAMKKIISNLNEKDIILITEKNKTHKADNYVLQGSRRNMFKYIFIIPINFILNILYFIHYNPKVIITTGAHTGVFMCYLGRIFRRKVIFIEVYDRFKKLTLSGNLSYLVATDFIVQHKELQKKYKKSKYIGGLY